MIRNRAFNYITMNQTNFRGWDNLNKQKGDKFFMNDNAIDLWATQTG